MVPVVQEGASAAAGGVRPTVAFLPWGDRFEDFHDKIGISLETFRDELTGTWLFNYVQAFRHAGLEPVLYFVSARIRKPKRFVHKPTGTPLRFLPAPWLHRKMQGARDRFGVWSPAYRSVLSYVATPWPALVRELRRDGCQAILCQEYEYARFDEAVAVGRLLRIPVFATYQGGNAPGALLELPFRRRAVRWATGLIIPSRAEIQRVRSVYGGRPERIAYIPNAIDTREWQAVDRLAARAALGISADARVVVWHGRVEIHSKGLDLLLDAWKRVHRERTRGRLMLLLVGSAQDDVSMRDLVASFSPDAVRWEDRYVREPELLRRYLSAADIATKPSRAEGFSSSILEAMACGLPVVATDISGVADALGGDDPAGVIVPPEDPASLAEAFGRLLDDEPLRRTLGERARRRAEERFSLEVVGAQLRTFMERRGALGSAG